MRPLATGILKPFTIRNRANRAKGLCQCGREPVQGKACCASCREKYRSYQGRLKAQVIAAYGGKCQCPSGKCRETIVEFLTIDHKHNDGSAHRAEHKMSSYRFYKWLLEQGCPTDRFQVLCWNCNMGKIGNRANRGVCPHEQGTKRGDAGVE